MNISKVQLQQAVEQGILSQQQASQLVEFVHSHPAGSPRFDFSHLLYYLGGLIAIGAMTLFMNLGWERFGGWGVFFISLLYAGIGLRLCQGFAARGYAVPAAVCATFVVAVTPLAIFGLQQGLGLWPDDQLYRDYHRHIAWQWLYMELGTLAVGLIMVWRLKYAFLVMPIAVTLWYLSMDVAALLTGGWVEWELRMLVSLYMGLLIIALAFWVDIRSVNQADYAFWLYLFGALAFWCGLSFQHSDSEWSKLLYCLLNLGLMGVGMLLVRRIFVVLGALGVCLYLGHLASNLFRDSWLFPIALTAIGLLVVYLGILWQKHESSITQRVRGVLPEPLRRLLASRLPA